MSGTGKENIFEGLDVAEKCHHRALQLCKEQRHTFTAYVCGRCSAIFEVSPFKDAPKVKEPMFPKHKALWGTRSRQA